MYHGGISYGHRDISLPNECTIASKIIATSKGIYLPISKLHSILAVSNLLAHNNISQICYKFHYRVLQLTAIFSENLNTFRGGGVTFIWLAMVRSNSIGKACYQARMVTNTEFLCFCSIRFTFSRSCSCRRQAHDH